MNEQVNEIMPPPETMEPMEPVQPETGQNEEFAYILDAHQAAYQAVDYYLQVGTLTETQGWLLHISVIISQYKDMLVAVIPGLMEAQVPFKIVRDRDTARYMLDGILGYQQLGKLLTVYPGPGTDIVSLVKKLIDWTSPFKGPDIPTDAHLGACVFTRYGAFNPVLVMNEGGGKDRLIYDPAGNLIPDEYTIPFQLPRQIKWPFTSIPLPHIRKDKKILNGLYKSVSAIKTDARGNVYRGVYFKRIFHMKPCLIKQGKRCMSSDMEGRDMKDRLFWQKKLHNELKGVVPLPAIIEVFEEEGDTYLVMEFIKGISLHDLKLMINGGAKTWVALPTPEKLRILDYIRSMLTSLEAFHRAGFVHRDICPLNFMVTEKNEIVLIDIELAYSLRWEQPTPPFGIGTPGFMSPEQVLAVTPTVKEDIYGICASMIELLVGLTPIKLNPENARDLYGKLYFFIRNAEMAKLIVAGLRLDPLARPGLEEIRAVVEKYREDLHTGAAAESVLENEPLDRARVEETVRRAIQGLVLSPTVIHEDLWCSPTTQKLRINAQQQKEFAYYPGLHEGLAGPLYCLARAKIAGIDIEPCMPVFNKAWDFLYNNYLSRIPELPSGLYYGSAGIGLSMAYGMEAGLVIDNEEIRQVIYQCLASITNPLPAPGQGPAPTPSPAAATALDISAGMAGHGVAILQCMHIIGEEAARQLLDPIVSYLIRMQDKEGAWKNSHATGKTERIMGIGEGAAGIAWFLLEYGRRFHEEAAKASARKTIGWLCKKTADLTKLFDGKIYLEITGDEFTIEDGPAGIIITMIKAFETLGDPHLKEITASILDAYPYAIISTNLSQSGGLAGLGEIYLEAAKVFGEDKWNARASWIANAFLHSCNNEPGTDSCYWLLNENTFSTADFMTGGSGIIGFLMRCLHPDKLGYRLFA